jgi:hypothetical protein
MLATAAGMTLYAHDNHRFTLAGGSHDDRNALRGDPDVGRKIGVKGCEGECLSAWTPLKAADNAQPWGYWTIVARPDGTHQWAYRGYPLTPSRTTRCPATPSATTSTNSPAATTACSGAWHCPSHYLIVIPRRALARPGNPLINVQDSLGSSALMAVRGGCLKHAIAV